MLSETACFVLSTDIGAQTENLVCTTPAVDIHDSPVQEESMPGVLYFYPTPFNFSCIGRVVAYDYCYKYNSLITGGAPQDVVTIVVLETVGESYKVVWTRVERDYNCGIGTMVGINRCCVNISLTTDETFAVTTNSAYGLVIPGSTMNVLLALESSATGYLLVAPSLLSDPNNLPLVGSTLTQEDLSLSGMQPQSLTERSFKFSISKYQGQRFRLSLE